MEQVGDLSRQLAMFFNDWRDCSQSRPLADKLAVFFKELKGVLPLHKELEQKSVPGEGLDPEKLQGFFDTLSDPLAQAKRAGFLCDPWAVATLKRYEVRNSAVLAWWLDPKGTHGLEGTFLRQLLRSIGWTYPISKSCRVRVESNPDGDLSNRVDIEVDDPNFYLIIEVKIDALEGNEQIHRYCQIADKRSASRPWAVLFLTTQGRNAFLPVGHATDVDYVQKVIPLSWKKMSSLLNGAIGDHMSFFNYKTFPELEVIKMLARTYCNHIRQF